MKIAIVIVDNRDAFREYEKPVPWFGTAPEALLQGMAEFPDAQIHIVSCTQVPMTSPEKLGANIWFHSLLVRKIGWLRSGYSGCIRTVRKKLWEIRPDIVHGQGTERYCALSAVFCGFPNVLTIHGNMRLVAKVNGARPFSFEWLAARLESFAVPRSDGVVCITAYTQRAVASLAKKTWLLPNAVDAAFFAIQPRPVTPREIACVAQISPRKNQIKLIQALEPLAAQEQFQLVFYGGAFGEDHFVIDFRRMLETRPWCRYGGMLDRAELRAALAGASMLVLPSLEDNCPMTVLEAMAAGLPVAAGNVGGVPELVADKVNGILFDPHDAESIRNGVAAVLLDAKTSARLAAAGKKKALATFHPKRIAARHLEIYEEVLGRRPSRG